MQERVPTPRQAPSSSRRAPRRRAAGGGALDVFIRESWARIYRCSRSGLHDAKDCNFLGTRAWLAWLPQFPPADTTHVSAELEYPIDDPSSAISE